MPWRTDSLMSQRLEFIQAVLHRSPGQSIRDVCRAIGISERVGHKWLERYGESRPAARLGDESQNCLLREKGLFVSRYVGRSRDSIFPAPSSVPLVWQRSNPELTSIEVCRSRRPIGTADLTRGGPAHGERHHRVTPTIPEQFLRSRSDW